MADEIVSWMLDEVASDGHQGTTINRFIYLFTQPHSPAILARPSPSTSSTSTTKKSQTKKSTARPTFSPAEQTAIDKHAAYVWKILCSIDGIDVYLLPEAGTIQRKKEQESPSKDAHPSRGSTTNGGAEDIEIEGRRDLGAEGVENRERSQTPLVEVGAPTIDPSLIEEPVENLCQSAGTDEIQIPEPDIEPGLLTLQTGAGDMLDLRNRYGNRVVMRASEKRILLALTGEAIKSAKYGEAQEETAELIARSRGRGISSLTISKSIKSVVKDPKRTHYIVKSLGNLGLVIKIATTENRQSTNLMVHRKYQDLNPELQIRRETLEHDEDAGLVGRDEDDDTEPIPDASGLPQFRPFGREQLVVYHFIQRRLTRLLRCNLYHHMLENKGVLKTLGFEPTVNTRDRRQWNKHLRRMQHDGLLEIVLVTESNGKSHRCLRLTEYRPIEPEVFEGENPFGGEIVAADNVHLGGDGDADGEEGEEETAAIAIPFSTAHTIEYQVLNQVKLSGTNGLFMSDICDALANFERKSVEAFLSRYENARHVPPQLQDHNISSTSELHGKERRTRYYTVDNLRKKFIRENVPLPKSLPPPSDSKGEFVDVDENALFLDRGEYGKMLDALETRSGAGKAARPKTPAPARIGRPPKDKSASGQKSKKANKDKAVPDDSAEPEAVVRPSVDVSAPIEDNEEGAESGAENEHDGPRGRPRKYIKILNLRGELVRRRKSLLIKNGPGLPQSLLYNEGTGVFFAVPSEWCGEGPIPKPAKWDTDRKTTLLDLNGNPMMTLPRPPSKHKRAKWGERNEVEDLLAQMRQSEVIDVDSDPVASTSALDANPLSKIDSDPPSGRSAIPKQKKQATQKIPKTKKTQKKQTETTEMTTGGPSEASEVPTDLIDPALLAEAADVGPQGGVDSSHGFMDSSDAPTDVAYEISAVDSTPSIRVQGPQADDLGLAASAKTPKRVRENDSESVQAGNRSKNTTPTPTAKRARKGTQQPETPTALEVKDNIKTVSNGKKPRPSSSGPPRTSMEQIYRKRHTLATLQDLGGIAIGGRTLARSVKEWWDRQNSNGTRKSGEAQGLYDARTMSNVLVALENEGSIKTRKINTGEALDKLLTVVALPDVADSDIYEFVKATRRIGPGGHLKHDATFTPPFRAGEASFTRLTGPRRHVRISKEYSLVAYHTPGAELDSLPAAVCREMFLRDWHIIPQAYGLVYGSHRRAEHLHRRLAHEIEDHPLERRFIPIDFLFSGIPVSVFCECIPITVLDASLQAFLQDPVTRTTPVSHCPEHIRKVIGAERAPTRKKVLTVVAELVALGLVRPVTLFGDSVTVDDLEKASHLQLATSTLIRNYGQAEPGCPPVVVKPVITATEVGHYWYDLWYLSSSRGEGNQEAVIKQTEGAPELSPSFPDVPADSESVKLQMAKPGRWQKEYVMTAAQRKYIQWKFSSHPGQSIVDNQDVLQDLAYRVFAPMEVVQNFVRKLDAQRIRRQRHDERINRKVGKQQKTARVQKQIREAIAEKTRQRDIMLDQQWQMMVQNNLPQVNLTSVEGLEKYLAPIKKDFLRNPGTFNPHKVPLLLGTFAKRQMEGVQRQSRRRAGSTRVVARNASNRSGIRNRTMWNPEADELARDAYAVMLCRLRRLPKLKANQRQFEALKQIWPDQEPLKIVNRVKNWLKAREAHEAYFDRLCMAWEKQVKIHQGGPELPDVDPQSLNNFDLVAHIDLLRQTVKKGILLRNVGEIREEDRLPPLQASVEAIESENVVENIRPSSQREGFDRFWKGVGELNKESMLSRISALTLSDAEMHTYEGIDMENEVLPMAETTIKMLVAEESGAPDVESAQTVMSRFPPSVVQSRLDELRGHKQWLCERPNFKTTPGRAYEFTDHYKNRLAEPLPEEFQQDALDLLEDIAGAEDYLEWPIICKEGEFASLMTFVAEGKIDFEVDLEPAFRMFAKKEEYATKTLDDADQEISLAFKTMRFGDDRRLPNKDSPMGDPEVLGVAVTEIEAAGYEGITFPDLVARTKQLEPMIEAVVHLLKDSSQPIHLVGYAENRLVHSNYLQHWSIACKTTSGDGVIQKVPKQWLDVHGDPIEEVFKRCVAKVYGTITQRTGISEAVLRKVLAGVIDRQEANEIIQYLIDRKEIERVFPKDFDSSLVGGQGIVGLADLKGETLVHYVPSQKWGLE